MSASIQATAPTLAVIDGKPTTTSNEVAQTFGKRHDHVTRDIRTIIDSMGGVPKIGETVIFTDSVYTNEQNGETYPAYRLTRDGFTLLAMGFTGKKALAFKLAYIDAFNTMEAALHKAALPTTLTPAQQQRIKAAVEQRCGGDSKAYSQLYRALYAAFNVPTYKDLPGTEFDTALRFIAAWQPLALPAPAAHTPSLLGRRFVVAIDDDGSEYIKPIRHDAMLGNWDDFARRVENNDSVPRPIMLRLANASAQHLYASACNVGEKGIGEQVAKLINRDLAQSDLRAIVTSACLELWLRAAPHSGSTGGEVTA